MTDLTEIEWRMLADICESYLNQPGAQHAAPEHARLAGRLIETVRSDRPDSDSHTETLAAYREYYEASQAVEQGVVDFDLHSAAVARLEAATERVRVVRAD